jgi:hypothetical protein
VHFSTSVNLARQARNLAIEPHVAIGPIHSVKAGDAAHQRHGPQRDAMIRLSYVGMTRVPETLYICQRASSMAATL